MEDGGWLGKGLFLIIAVLFLSLSPCLSLSLQELECLQDHLEDLMPACREVVGNLTELESEVFAHRGLLPDLPLNSSCSGCHSRAPASGDCGGGVVLKRTSVC